MGHTVETVAGPIQVEGGKEIEITDAEEVKGLKPGEKVIAFETSKRVNFKVSYSKEFKGTKHVKEGTIIDMHILDAQIAEKMGKGQIVK